MVYVVKSAATEDGVRFISTVDNMLSPSLSESITKHVAFDCEGVNLSRVGSVELVSICFPSKDVFLIDFGGNTCSKIVKKVKDLFESDEVVKIIHDCRMDCDALFHLHGIKVINVHDTSCFHHIITGMENKNLNDVLSFNGICLNSDRDKSVYKHNPSFWAARPLTTKMIDWASSDVDKLFKLSNIQLDRISSSTSRSKAIAKSAEFASVARNMKIRTGLKVRNVGIFIGRGGANIRRLEKRTDTLIYQEDRSKGTWFVYYSSESSLAIVKREMDN